MNHKQKAKLSIDEKEAKKLAENVIFKKYKISNIVTKQNVTLEEAEIIYNTRAQKKEVIGKFRKRKITKKKKKSVGETRSVYTSLEGVTGARTWNKIK